MIFEDHGPPIKAEQPLGIGDVPQGSPIATEAGGGGGVAGVPVPLGTPYVFPLWVIL